VSVWKGAAKVAGMAAMGAAVIGAFVHHLLAGANRVSKKDEEQAADLAEGAD
jgi:formate dehydrogenase iron-sulfur subunit